MFTPISQFCQNYYDQIPDDSLKTIAFSGVLSFVAEVFVITLSSPTNQTPNLTRSAFAFSIAVVAASIHAITTPIFNYLFDNPKHEFNGYQEYIQILVDITLTHVLINHTTSINLITAMNLQNGNFIILPSNILKSSTDIGLRLLNLLDPTVSADLRHMIEDIGMDFNSNTTPIYGAI